MKPSDARNATWAEVEKLLNQSRIAVYAAWQRHGPGTTREVSSRAGISILTLRPRTTDLCELGLVRVVGAGPGAKECIYRAVPFAEAKREHERKIAESKSEQMALF